MEIDYSPFLHVLKDGSIWLRLNDAMKPGSTCLVGTAFESEKSMKGAYYCEYE